MELFFDKYFIIILTIFGFYIIEKYIEILNITQKISKKDSYNIKNIYEYIIVGTGTGGSSVISGIPSDDVLILEIGVYHTSFLLDVPVLTPALFMSDYDWNYVTEPQDNACLGLKQHRSRWPRGKIYGGSHILNNMIHHRGHPDDFKGWFSPSQNYSYEKDILPFFIESEKYFNISKPKYTTKLSNIFVESGNLLFDGNRFSQPNLTQWNGQRFTESHFNYKTTKHKILVNARVTKILFNKLKNKAIGLEFYQNRKIKRVFSKNGIILSAGTIETPKLLMLSGIGIKNDLKKLNIDVIKELPVGLNLQDHVTTGMDLVLLNETLGISPIDLLTIGNLYNYLLNGKGPFTHGGCDGIGFVKLSSNSSRYHDYPDISYILLPMGVSTDNGVKFRNVLNINDNLWKNYFAHFIKTPIASIIPILLHPKSRGYIKLQSNDPFASPLINPNYLKHPDDIKILIKSLKLLNYLLQVPEMKKLNAELNPKLLPGCENYQFKTTEYWDCYIRQLTLTMYHPVGTCRMGYENNANDSVVDQNFKVHGIDNLYIVDGSILPNLPSGNPNAVIAMLGKKFLNYLKQKYNLL